MRFGILNFSAGPYDRIARRWKRFEELGFDNAWVADDLLGKDYADFEAWTLLGALARDTSRITIGTLVTTIRLRHPAFLAAQVLGLDQISGGRAAVGIGVGEAYQTRTVGEAAWSLRETAERLEEYSAALAPMLRGEHVVNSGSHYSIKTVGWFDEETGEMPQPVTRPRPPLVVAAHGKKGIATAVRHADAWNCLGGQGYAAGPRPDEEYGGRTLAEAVAHVRELLERVDEACAEEGRDPATLERTILAFYPEPDPFSSLDAFDEYVGAYEELGISGITFYWPPIDIALAKVDTKLESDEPTAKVQARFDSICAERIAPK